MPSKAPKSCRYPGCPNLVTSDQFCPEHTDKGRGYDQDRGSAASRGYGHRWRRLRNLVLRRHPLCADPFGVHRLNKEVVPAKEVDHIVPLSQGGANKLSNLQALCKSCHSRKTRAGDVRSARGDPSTGGRGNPSLEALKSETVRGHSIHTREIEGGGYSR